MDEPIEKSYLSYLSFLPFRYDSITGFFVSIVTFSILNIPWMVILAIANAFGGIDFDWELFWSTLGIIIVIVLIYLPFIMFKNKSKSYNIGSIIFAIIFVNFGWIMFLEYNMIFYEY